MKDSIVKDVGTVQRQRELLAKDSEPANLDPWPGPLPESKPESCSLGLMKISFISLLVHCL